MGIDAEPNASRGYYSGDVTDPAETNTPVTPRCPWCSTQVTDETVTCPTCGATLREEAAADIPGLTQVDPGASAVRPTARGRGLIGWLSGDYETTDTDVDKAGVEPPSTEVRHEMLRLEMDALRSEIEAEAASRAVEAPATQPEAPPTQPEAPPTQPEAEPEPEAELRPEPEAGSGEAAAAKPAPEAGADGTEHGGDAAS